VVRGIYQKGRSFGDNIFTANGQQSFHERVLVFFDEKMAKTHQKDAANRFLGLS
jgi:hypothetical protein